MSISDNICETCPGSARIIFRDCFTEMQKSIIAWYILKIEALIATRAPKIINPSYNWQIKRIFSSSTSDIIVNDRTMQLLSDGFQSQDSNIISSAFHYFFKAYLANYLKEYKTQEELNKIYYEYWGYNYKSIRISNDVKMGYIISLKFHGNQRDYHPILTNTPNGLKPTLIELISRKNSCYEVTNIRRSIDSAECLLNRFNGLYAPVSTNIHEIVDPNQIFMTIISEYVVSNYRYIGNNPASPDIYNAIDHIIGHDCLANLGQKAYPLS